MSKTSKRRPRDRENPPLLAKRLAAFRPSRDVVPAVVAAYERRRGRPPTGEATKIQVTLRLDPAVLAHFKKDGPGWQSRIGETLARAVKRKKARTPA